MKLLLLCSVFYVANMALANERQLDGILRQSNSLFTAKMFSEVLKDEPNQSLVLSPFSVLTPLAQLALASVGESHDEILAAIAMPNDTITKAVFSRVHDKLKSVKGVTLKTASKIYVANSYELNNSFTNLIQDIFGSEIENVDFTKTEETAQDVNRWVEEQTNNRIKDLVDPISLHDNIKAVLVNAIYFKGLWETPFNKEQTRDRNFHVNEEKVVIVPFMHNKGEYNYINSKELNAQVLKLEYKGGESALYIFLPHEVDGIKQLDKELNNPRLLNYIGMEETEVEVFLPRFRIETMVNLKEVLQNMNIKRLFNGDEARLENLLKTGNSGLYISEAKQKAFIEVNEEGAEAAAANYFSDRIIGGRRLVFDADHPFIFFLTQGNNILFTGTYFA